MAQGQKKQKVFIVSRNGSLLEGAYRSIKWCCINNDLCYASALKGKRIWQKKVGHENNIKAVMMIHEFYLVKNKTRGINAK